jgi:hypothetical protein
VTLGSTAMTESTGMGARARLFLIAFAAITIAAISHPSLGAGAIYPGENASGTTSVEAPAVEPASEPAPVAESTATEAPAVEPASEPAPVDEGTASEESVAAPTPVAESAADELAAEGLAAEADPAPAEPVLEGPPAEAAAAAPGEEPAAVTPVEEVVAEPTGDAPVATLPVALEAAAPEEPELATPAAEPEQSVVIQTSSELESLPPISGELRTVLLTDGPMTLTRLADVSSVGTTRRTASDRPARGPVDRTASEVGWPPQIPSPSAPPVPSRLALTFSGQAASGGSFRADLALALSAFVFAFSLMARVASPVNSRLHEAALVTRVPQPG